MKTSSLLTTLPTKFILKEFSVQTHRRVSSKKKKSKGRNNSSKWKQLVPKKSSPNFLSSYLFSVIKFKNKLFFLSQFYSFIGMGGRKGRDGLFPATSCESNVSFNFAKIIL